MGECADRAAGLGTGLLIEAINRYETPLLNTAADTLAAVGTHRPAQREACSSTPST